MFLLLKYHSLQLYVALNFHLIQASFLASLSKDISSRQPERAASRMVTILVRMEHMDGSHHPNLLVGCVSRFAGDQCSGAT